MIAPIMFLRRSPLNPPFLIPTIRLSPVPCPTAHLPTHETCPHRPHPPPPPPPSVSPYNFPLGRRKSLPFPPIVLNRWDLPCRRKRGEISDARFRWPVSCRSDARIDDRPAPMAMGRAEPIGTTSGKPE